MIEVHVGGRRARRVKSIRKWGRNCGGESVLGFGVRSLFIAEAAEGRVMVHQYRCLDFQIKGRINSNGKKDFNPIRSTVNGLGLEHVRLNHGDPC
jgi:hypothetical protein